MIENGQFFERGGVNFSHVHGEALPPSASAGRSHLTGRAFEAMGVSLVLHPRNPYCPTVHMNVRLFCAQADSRPAVWWLGGGMDLTPHYGFEEDAHHFHRTRRNALQPFGADIYRSFKLWCDDYFYLPHRGEPCGVGGIFFNDFCELGFDGDFAMTRSVGAMWNSTLCWIAARFSACKAAGVPSRS